MFIFSGLKTENKDKIRKMKQSYILWQTMQTRKNGLHNKLLSWLKRIQKQLKIRPTGKILSVGKAKMAPPWPQNWDDPGGVAGASQFFTKVITKKAPRGAEEGPKKVPAGQFGNKKGPTCGRFWQLHLTFSKGQKKSPQKSQEEEQNGAKKDPTRVPEKPS